MRSERMFGINNAKLRPIFCGCAGRGWLATLVFSETSKQIKLVLLCACCETNWMEVDDPDLNLLPEYASKVERTEGVEGAR